MIINSEDTRRAHPQACFIPMPILRFQFQGYLSDVHLRLLSLSLEEIMAYIPALYNYSSDEKLRCLLCIALRHPAASDEALMQAAKEFDISTEELLTNAALIGRLDIINRLFTTLDLVEVQRLIKYHYYKAFRFAALGGSLAVIRRFIDVGCVDATVLIAAQNYQPFQFAALGGHLPLIEEFIRLYPTAVFAMVKSYDYEAFRLASRGGHVDVMEKLKMLLPESEQFKMIRAREFAAFRLAAEGGSLPALEKMISLAPAELLNMIRGGNYAAFYSAARYGHLHILERLLTLAPDEFLNMISAENYSAFRFAAEGGYLHVLEWLIAHAKEKIGEMVQAYDYDAFWRAAKGGHLAVMERFIVLAPHEVPHMVSAHRYKAFCEAARGGYLPVLEKLINLAPHQKLAMIKTRDYEAFRLAAAGGRLDVIEWLIAQAPDELLHMIRANNYEAFRLAAENGHLAVVNRLAILAPAEVIPMIKADNYRAFGNAAENGCLAIINRLIALAPTEVLSMVKSNNYGPLQWAAEQGRHLVVYRLLSFAEVMAHAEIHEREYDSFVRPFIANTLSVLRSKRSAFEATHHRVPFDVLDDNTTKNYFYILRHLIRRNNSQFLDDIRFLLEIPAVRALAHTGKEENELLRLALTIGNRAAAEILVMIPAVKTLAEAHDYYSAEARGELNLKDLAKDAESSLHALSCSEQKRLAAAITHYKPLMDTAGVERIFENLCDTLKKRYADNPAKINVDDKEIILPLDWISFKALELTPVQYEAALKAYYQHKDHTAFRYLSHPNPWISLKASYVYINPDNMHERWATFEEYAPLLAMLWLAVQDESIPPTDGHTLTGRIEHFIDELAQIGRAHNWDNSRIKVTSSGEPMVDSEGNVIEEEYDDLAGDKPSCFSGVKRRLLQSVIGHPLLKVLTAQDIQQELRDFLRTHFISLINDINRDALAAAWHNYCMSADLSEAEPLRLFDISAQQQALFVQHLTEKYGEQFSEDFKFNQMVKKAFERIERKSNPSDCMHALKFAGLINLTQLLAPPVKHAVISKSFSAENCSRGAAFFPSLLKLGGVREALPLPAITGMGL